MSVHLEKKNHNQRSTIENAPGIDVNVLPGTVVGGYKIKRAVSQIKLHVGQDGWRDVSIHWVFDHDEEVGEPINPVRSGHQALEENAGLTKSKGLCQSYKVSCVI